MIPARRRILSSLLIPATLGSCSSAPIIVDNLAPDPDRRASSTAGDCAAPAWWLWLSGVNEAACTPEGPDGMTIKGRYPIRAGCFVNASRLAPDGAEAGPDEAWLISADSRARVLTGSIDDSHDAAKSVSPDGCKAAFRYAPPPSTAPSAPWLSTSASAPRGQGSKSEDLRRRLALEDGPADGCDAQLVEPTLPR
jgi:hypothetical protein